jgi:hypothetical protein
VKVVIGLLLSGGFPVPAAFVIGFADVLRVLLTGEGNRLLPANRQITTSRIISSQGFPVDTARNEVCRLFLEDGGDYLLFLDADMRHPADIAHRLLAHDLPLVTGRYQMRKPPFHTVAMRKIGPGPNDYKAIRETAGVVPIDAGGAGCLLIRRDVLEAIRASVGDDWFRYQTGPNGLRTVSEDMWFYEQAKACGFQAFCDLDTVSSHVASFEVGPEWHEPYVEAYERAIGVSA